MRSWGLATLAVAALCARGAAQSPSLQPGDRIVLVGGTFADLMREDATLETLLLTRRPELGVTLRNLGWAGDRLGRRARPTGFPTLATSLVALQADVVLVCHGMGEAIEGGAELEAVPDRTSALVDALLENTNGHPPRIVLVSPIAAEDLGDRTPDTVRLNENLKQCVIALSRLAAERNLPLVDLYTPTSQIQSLADGPRLTRNGVHPNALGYWVAGQVLAESLGVTRTACRILVDLEDDDARVEAATLHDWQQTAEGLTLVVERRFLAAPPPPIPGPYPVIWHRWLGPRLAVSGLEEGTYSLRIGERELARASAEKWHEGLWLTAMAKVDELARLETAIRDKNRRFFHQYRALNTVHTIGERRQSPSGQALPDELAEMEAALQEQEQVLAAWNVKPAVERWILTREETP